MSDFLMSDVFYSKYLIFALTAFIANPRGASFVGKTNRMNLFKNNVEV
jgi:hypothetical protein